MRRRYVLHTISWEGDMYCTRSLARTICITLDIMRWRYVLHAIVYEGNMHYTRSHAREICIARDLMRGRCSLISTVISKKGMRLYRPNAKRGRKQLSYDDIHQVIESLKHYMLPSVDQCHLCLNETRT